jgi:hypothetical protein
LPAKKYHFVIESETEKPVSHSADRCYSVENAFLSAIRVADQPTIHFKSLA